MTGERRAGFVEVHQDLGALKANVKALEGNMSEIKADVKTLLAAENSRSGVWRMLTMFGAVAGSMGGAAAYLLGFVNGVR